MFWTTETCSLGTLFVISLFSIDVPHTEERMDDNFIENINILHQKQFIRFLIYEHNLISFNFVSIFY